MLLSQYHPYNLGLKYFWYKLGLNISGTAWVKIAIIESFQIFKKRMKAYSACCSSSREQFTASQLL